MREILFRGKHKDTKLWVKGSYVFCRNHHYILPHYNEDGYDERWAADWKEVDPETVGQMLLKYKTGEMIFEHDIVIPDDCDEVYEHNHYDEEKDEYVSTHKYIIKWDSDLQAFNFFNLDGIHSADFEMLPNWNYIEIKVIGNIHDNKDLLEAVK